MAVAASPYRQPQQKRATQDGIAQANMRLQFRAKRSRLEPRPPPVIFDRLHMLIPESKLFSQLLELEKAVDRAVLRKQLDIQEAIRVRPARTTKLLRVYVSNSFTAQAPAYQADEPSATLFDPPSWSLRIEGSLIDSATGGT